MKPLFFDILVSTPNAAMKQQEPIWQDINNPYVKLLDALLIMDDMPLVQATLKNLWSKGKPEIQMMCSHWGYTYATQRASSALFECLQSAGVSYPKYKADQLQNDPLVCAAHMGTALPIEQLYTLMKSVNTKNQAHQIAQCALKTAMGQKRQNIVAPLLACAPQLVTVSNANEWARHLGQERFFAKKSRNGQPNAVHLEQVFKMFAPVLEQQINTQPLVGIDPLQMQNTDDVEGFMHPRARFVAHAPIWMWDECAMTLAELTQWLTKRSAINSTQKRCLEQLQRPALCHYWHVRCAQEHYVPDAKLIDAMRQCVQVLPHSLVQDAIMCNAGDNVLTNIQTILECGLEKDFTFSHPLLTHFVLVQSNLDQKKYSTQQLCDLWKRYQLPPMSPVVSAALTISALLLHQEYANGQDKVAQHVKMLYPWLDADCVQRLEQCFEKPKTNVHTDVQWVQQQQSLRQWGYMNLQTKMQQARLQRSNEEQLKNAFESIKRL